jgi:hypothetical protein
MNLKTVLTWSAVSFVLWWLINQPSSAAHLIDSIGAVVNGAAHGLSNFVATI